MSATHVDLNAARLAIAVAGLAVFLLGQRWPPLAPGRRLRKAALVSLALAALASYYDFFLHRHFGGTKDGDAFTYYVGSKYFSELGYFGLYDCTVAAQVELDLAGREAGAGTILVPEIRDLRTFRYLDPAQLRERSTACRARFEPRRWREFRDDVAWFRSHSDPGGWLATLRDHGYNPPPAWTVIGGGIASLTTADSPAFRWLILVDRVLLGLLLATVGWAFGLEIACLTAIVWGTGSLWSYSWIGDSYLRLLWLIAAIGGLCLLRKGRYFWAGFSIAIAALLRLFPGIFAVGYLLYFLRRRLRERIDPLPLARFGSGAAVAVVVLIGAALFSGIGLDAGREFVGKIRLFTETEFSNTVGLPILARELTTASTALTSPGSADAYPMRWVVILVQLLRLAVVGLFMFRWWRAIAGLEDWEAAASSFTCVPILTASTNYYYGFVLAAPLLASRHRRLGPLALGAGAAWIANGLLPYSSQSHLSIGASLIAVVFSFAVVRVLSSPSPGCGRSPRSCRRGIARPCASSSVGRTKVAREFVPG